MLYSRIYRVYDYEPQGYDYVIPVVFPKQNNKFVQGTVDSEKHENLILLKYLRRDCDTN